MARSGTICPPAAPEAGRKREEPVVGGLEDLPALGGVGEARVEVVGVVGDGRLGGRSGFGPGGRGREALRRRAAPRAGRPPRGPPCPPRAARLIARLHAGRRRPDSTASTTAGMAWAVASRVRSTSASVWAPLGGGTGPPGAAARSRGARAARPGGRGTGWWPRSPGPSGSRAAGARRTTAGTGRRSRSSTPEAPRLADDRDQAVGHALAAGVELLVEPRAAGLGHGGDDRRTGQRARVVGAAVHRPALGRRGPSRGGSRRPRPPGTPPPGPWPAPSGRARPRAGPARPRDRPEGRSGPRRRSSSAPWSWATSRRRSR